MADEPIPSWQRDASEVELRRAVAEVTLTEARAAHARAQAHLETEKAALLGRVVPFATDVLNVLREIGKGHLP